MPNSSDVGQAESAADSHENGLFISNYDAFHPESAELKMGG
jgi:hypothetical protein